MNMFLFPGAFFQNCKKSQHCKRKGVCGEEVYLPVHTKGVYFLLLSTLGKKVDVFKILSFKL